MTGAVESLGRVRAKGLALLAVAFVVGALCGAAAARMLSERQPGGFVTVPGPAEVTGVPPVYNELGLSDAQRRRIEQILRSARPETDSLVQATLPRLRALADSIDREMRAVLTPEQRAELDRRFPGSTPGAPGGPPVGIELSGPDGPVFMDSGAGTRVERAPTPSP